MSTYDDWIANIPFQFRDKPNISAIIKAFSKQLDAVKAVNRQLTEAVDIDTARGMNLDMIGTIVNVTRKDAHVLMNREMSVVITDEMYRNVLRFQALKNNSDATYADIMKGMYLLWGDAKIKYAEAIREPASIEISIAEITTDETDPALIRPMVIRPGGVKILFRSSYTDKIDMVSWERFGNCKLSYEKNHRWNGAFRWNSAIRWHSDGVTFSNHYDGLCKFDGSITHQADGAKYNYYDGKNRFNGKINWGSFTEKEDIDLADAVLLNQAKRKILKSHFDADTSCIIAGFVFGTGLGADGKPYVPDADQTELVNEIVRKKLDSKMRISDSSYRYTGMLSEIEGNGKYITEIGLVDEDGDLVCIKTFDKKIKNKEAEMTFNIDDILA